MDTPILELVKVNKTFRLDLLKPKHQALKDISCSFKTGTASAVMGHNGAGKTTSMRTILGLISADSGQVLFKGKPIVTEDRRSIGYMPETNKLPGELRSQELLYFHLNLYKPQLSRKDKHALVEEKLTQVGLSQKHKGARISTLSKGLGRRLAWAMASIHEPELLILDEPFTGMDPLGRRDLSAWIGAHMGKGASVIITTHELDVAYALCSRFLIYKEGQIVYDGLSDLNEAKVLSFFGGSL